MSDSNYVEIPFKEFKYIENNYSKVRTVFNRNEDNIIYRTFAKDNNEIELKYEYLYDEEDGSYYVVYKKIPISH